MNTVKYSLIIPVYNAAAYLHRCIESVLSQTISNFELILVNDGSTDSSLEICLEYEKKDKRIKVINKLNGGVSSARNFGISESRGSFICFIDSDDFLEDDFLESFKHSDGIDLFSQGCTSEYMDQPSTCTTHTIEKTCNKAEAITELINTGLIMTPWAKLYSASIIKTYNLRFNEKHSYAEDRLFNVDYLRYCTTFQISKAHKYHYTHDNPIALTRKKYPSTLLLDYVKLYRPLLLEIISNINLTPETLSKAKYTYNYPLIQSVIQIISDKKSNYYSKRNFINAITSDLISDACHQSDLPILFKVTARILRLPSSISIPLIKSLCLLKRV